MSSSESDSTNVSEEDDEGKIYQLIYEMITTDDKEEKEEVQIPSSSGNTPVHLKIDAETTNADDSLDPVKCCTVDDTKGLDRYALDNIQEIPVRKAPEEKPWRKAGANISDYFNYGFDEQSWNTYCKKQAKVCAASKKLYTKIMVQKRHTGHEENDSCSTYPSSSSPSTLASSGHSKGFDGSSTSLHPCSSGVLKTAKEWECYIQQEQCNRSRKHGHDKFSNRGRERDRKSCSYSHRQQSATTDVIGEQPESSSRVEEGRCHSDAGNNSQVATEMSPEEDRFTSYHLPSVSNFNSLFAYIPPPPFLYRSGPPPPSPFAALDSGHSKGFDGSSTSLHPCSSGVSSLIPKCMASNAGVIDSAKAWGCYIRQEKCDGSREHGHDKDSNRGRDRDRESCSYSHSGEERMKHRDITERGHRRHGFDRFSGEKEEWHGERRHSDNNGGLQQPSCSSSSRRRDSGEDRDSQSRHKHKKTKRNKKEKKTSKTYSADQERILKCD